MLIDLKAINRRQSESVGECFTLVTEHEDKQDF